MKNILLLTTLLLSTFVGSSQSIYTAIAGEISFFSSTPIEDIRAVNKSVKGLINVKTNQTAFYINNIEFYFKKDLMKEHFNENYIESHIYKHSSFKGKIVGKVDFKKNGSYEVKVKGVLDIHGIKKNREIKGRIIVKDGKIKMIGEFLQKL